MGATSADGAFSLPTGALHERFADLASRFVALPIAGIRPSTHDPPLTRRNSFRRRQRSRCPTTSPPRRRPLSSASINGKRHPARSHGRRSRNQAQGDCEATSRARWTSAVARLVESCDAEASAQSIGRPDVGQLRQSRLALSSCRGGFRSFSTRMCTMTVSPSAHYTSHMPPLLFPYPSQSRPAYTVCCATPETTRREARTRAGSRGGWSD